MRILDKHKDFYDYLAGIYGIDNTVFFDRRGSIKLNQNDLIKSFYVENDFYGWNNNYSKTLLQVYTNDLYAIIEAGYYQYLLRAYNITRKKLGDLSSCVYTYDGDIELVRVFSDNKHYNDSPINMYPVSVYNYSLRKNKELPKNLNYSNDIRPHHKKVIKNPIFTDTRIPSILDAQTIYVNIFDYISSKADFDIVDTRDDVAKAVDHGFDKKTSFRNM
jgi:hypothetical protein